MAPRTFWKGYLKLSLVTCPVHLVPAITAQDRVSFRTLNAKTGNPVVSRYVDAESGAAVEDDDQVRGYPRGEDDYVLLEDDEIEAVALESARTIDIETFVPADSIGWIWYDRPHYLLPADPVGEEAFAVIRAAMAATRRAGIARLVMQGRERAVLLMARGRGIALWTLRFGDEVRDPAEYVEATDEAPTKDMQGLMKRLIEERTTDWDPAVLDDPVQANLRDIIARKKKARPKTAAKAQKDKAPDPPSNVVNIMDALRKSLASESGAAKPAKDGGKRPPRKPR
ncbi:MAG: Ku protein [Gemmobacter sp.]|nr:Ku protein [Gemmobacter sp.]